MASIPAPVMASGPNSVTETTSSQPRPQDNPQRPSARRVAVYRTVTGLYSIHSRVSGLISSISPSLGDFGDDDDDPGADSGMDDSDDEADQEDQDDEDDQDDQLENDNQSATSMHSDDESIRSSNSQDQHDSTPRASTSQDDQRHGAGSGARLGGGKRGLPVLRASKPSGKPAAVPVEEKRAVEMSAFKPSTEKVEEQAQVPSKTASAEKSSIRALQASTPPTKAPETHIVKVRKPDGTIVKVRRPIKPAKPDQAAEKAVAKQAVPERAVLKGNVPKQAVPKQTVAKQAAPESTAAVSQAREIEKIEPHRDEISRADTTRATTQGKDLEKGTTAVTVTEVEKETDSGLGVDPKPEKKGNKLARRTSKIAQVTIWTIMIAFPLLFVLLGILSAAATGMPESSSFGRGVSQVNKTAVSLWPIVYAAIVAQALRMYASWKVERGLRMMTLEQLINSHSVASSIKQPFLLKSLNWTSVGLFLLWSLSPLAGQALLRMSYLGPSDHTTNATIDFVDTTTYAVAFTAYAKADLFLASEPALEALFGSSVLATNRSRVAPMDTWGNIKIPRLDALKAADKTGFSTYLPPNGNYSPWSSLIGVPVGIPSNRTAGTVHFKDDVNSTFTLKSGYFAFAECLPMKKRTIDDMTAEINAIPTVLLPYGLNYTVKLVTSNHSSLLMAVLPPSAENSTNGIVYFGESLQDDVGGATHVQYTTCSFNQSFAESQVLCAGNNCAVTKMRGISAPRGNSVEAYDYGIWVKNFVAGLTSSLVELYLGDPEKAGTSDFQGNGYTELSSVPTSEFSARLALLLNTYWMAGLAPWDMTGTISEISQAVLMNTTTAVQVGTDSVYHAAWGWLSLLLFSAVLLLVGGVVGALLDSRTVGPDIFGFASSLAHKNKYMKLPTGNGTLGGPQRTRMLGDVVVMLQDVKPGHAVGKIALGTVENGGERLKPGRFYK